MSENPATWHIAAASICGTSHQRCGVPCQDAYDWAVLSSGTIVVAVADGAGSALHSDRGSVLAVKTATEFLRDRADDLLAQLHHHPDGRDEPCGGSEAIAATDQDLLHTHPSPLESSAQALVDQVLQAINQEAEQENWLIADLATTLVAVIADDRTAIAIQVGDGAAIVNDTTEQTIALTVPSNGEYANETTFITSQTARDTLQISTWHGELTHLAVMTDGLQRLALSFPQAVPHPPFFRPLFQFVSQTADLDLACSKLERFLASPRVTDRADDDLTLFLASRSQPIVEGAKI
ncbi:MAG: protein phosphatase 2C domain-containing protein [Oscillatoriales cyanobacterium]|nr:MAG: protein phosphatase 2C domain-containing protein [Oscillatoriales cyanobacterium]